MGDSLNEHAFCVIMAGGKGERFWPLSTDLAPKPFLKLVGEKSMIQLTVERALRIVPEERVFVILGEPHLAIAKEQLPGLREMNFIVEPAGRDTAPCVGFAALTLMMMDEKAVMITLPADHYVPDVEGFVNTIVSGLRCAESGDYLVTIGIKPTRPETGYGYINAYRPHDAQGVTCYEVDRIVEKPDEQRARSYLSEGTYYWNAGIFIWRASVVLRGLESHMPDLYAGLMEIKALKTVDPSGDILPVFSILPKQSIDYGLMEKADNVLMVPSGFTWDDVGTWTSLMRVSSGLDGDGNLRGGKTICVDTKDCVVYGDGITVGTLGVEDLVIVASGNGVLVCRRDRAQEVKKIVGQLE